MKHERKLKELKHVQLFISKNYINISLNYRYL